jgi:hypothetical protein
MNARTTKRHPERATTGRFREPKERKGGRGSGRGRKKEEEEEAFRSHF